MTTTTEKVAPPSIQALNAAALTHRRAQEVLHEAKETERSARQALQRAEERTWETGRHLDEVFRAYTAGLEAP